MEAGQPTTVVAHQMVEVTEEHIYGGDVTELSSVMNELVGQVEVEAETFDSVGNRKKADEVVNDINKVCA